MQFSGFIVFSSCILYHTKKYNFGSISSIRNENDRYFPVLFGVVMRPTDLNLNYGLYSEPHLLYNYLIADTAIEFRRRSQPSQLVAKIRNLLVKKE